MPGRFIAVEGLEGAGKTTAIQLITTYLQNNVENLVITREPGGTDLGEKLRALIKEPNRSEPINPLSELLMFYAARVQLIDKVIRPALNQGHWVIADRFELSTYAYQGGGRGINQAILDSLSNFCLEGLKPDLTIFLDIKPELGLKRALQRGVADRIEQESLAFFQRVYEGYHRAIPNLSNVQVINANLPLVEVQKSLQTLLENFVTKNVYF